MGGGAGGVLGTKSPGARWIFFFVNPLPFLTKKENKNTKGAMRKGRDSFSLEKTPNLAFCWGADQSGSPGAKAGGWGGLFTQRGGHSKELFRHHNNINNNNKRSPVSLRSAASPESVGDGSAGSPNDARSSPATATRPSRPRLSLFFFPFPFFLFFPFLFQTFLSVHLFSLCRPGPPLQRAPSVGEDQVGDAGFEPVPRDHLADLGRAVVRELEVRARARLQGEVQVSVQRRRRAETAQGHALKV